MSIKLPDLPDPVNHPPHYTRSSIECIDAIEAMVSGWSPRKAYRLGNVLKYLWRHVEKDPVESLQKAKWYLEREIESISPSPPASQATEK